MAKRKGDTELDKPEGKAQTLGRVNTWTDFSSSDPLYALKGEVATASLVDDNGAVDEDWLEFWQAMDLPVQGPQQPAVLGSIIHFCLDHEPVGGLGPILAELIKGHRVKTKVVEDALEATMVGREDTEGVLREMLIRIFPKGPQSEWGWSVLHPTSGFVELGLLLERLEAEAQLPLVEQPTWTQPRLKKAREVAAIDGGENGPRALADPHGRPVDFVRALSKAAFMTGDGEYTEGLSESQLDQLLDQLCTSQLDRKIYGGWGGWRFWEWMKPLQEQAASLVRDPSARLRVAMEKLMAAVEEVLANPPEEGDLAAVAQRLMLVQRLERAAEDASAMLVKDNSSTEAKCSRSCEELRKNSGVNQRK
eukprot:s2368_g5.t1